MQVEELVKLADSGNVKDIEEQWLKRLESDLSPDQWSEAAQILKALSKNGKKSEAESLATTTIEWLVETKGAEAALISAGAFLLALGQRSGISQTVVGLYTSAYESVDGLDVLLAEAGVAGDRPPRRALRTMDLCVKLGEGTFLADRHEHKAVRVERIDSVTWAIEVTDGRGTEEYNPVELADSFELASEDDFRVMRQFNAEALKEALNNKPGDVVESILKAHTGGINSDQLRRMLSPKFILDADWSKWWTRCRQALRRSAHVKLEGRAPYYLSYHESEVSLEEGVETKVKKTASSFKKLSLVEDYVRACKDRKQEPDKATLKRISDRMEELALRHGRGIGGLELAPWLVSARIRGFAGEEEANAKAKEILSSASVPGDLIRTVEDQSFWVEACQMLAESKPDALADVLWAILPHASSSVADSLAAWLVELGATREQFEQLADTVLKDSIALNSGLLWFWNGPSVEQAKVSVPGITLLTRMINVVAQIKHMEDMPTAERKKILSNTRDAVRARKYERSKEVVNGLEEGMAIALRTQVKRTDGLGTAAQEDLIRLIDNKFPTLLAQPEIVRWQREDVYYVTEDGMRKKQAEIDELVNVKMRENAIAIGKAAEHGDLSENSEYKFALEERDLLRARLAQMNGEMEIAEVLEPDRVRTDFVDIGCRVILEQDSSGTSLSITLFSSWETNVDAGIYNYRTPLAQAILGKKLEETVNLEFFDPPGVYTVKSIENALIR